jgi:hypothetical protein
LLARNAAFSCGPNLRIGSITEAIEAANMSMDNGWGVMVGVPIGDLCCFSCFRIREWVEISGNHWAIALHVYTVYIYNIDIIYIIIWYPVKIMCSEKNRTDVRKSLLQVFFVLMHACRLTYVLVYTDTLLCTRYIYICIYIYRCRIYIYMYTCIWIHYIYIIHIDTHANRHIGKELRSFDFGPGLSPFGWDGGLLLCGSGGGSPPKPQGPQGPQGLGDEGNSSGVH